MDITQDAVNLLIERFFATNMLESITAEDARTVLMELNAFTAQTETKLTAITDMVNEALTNAREAKEASDALALRTTATETVANRADSAVAGLSDRLDMIEEGGSPSGLTPEQVEANRVAREANTQRSTDNQNAITDLGRRTGLLETDTGRQDALITTAQETADGAKSTADSALSASGDNQSSIGTLASRTDALETAVGVEGEGEVNGTGIRGDVKANRRGLQATNQEVAEVKEIAERADQREIADGLSHQDFFERHGTTDGFPADTSYRGTGNQEYFDANQASIPGLIFQTATGMWTIPAITLPNVASGTPIRLSNAYLRPGESGTTSGSNPLFLWVADQGTRRIAGTGAVGTENQNDMIPADSVDSFTELNLNHALTGEDIIIRWRIVYNGIDATLTPSLTGFNVDFVGEFEGDIEDIVHRVTDAPIQALQERDRILEGQNTARAVEIAGIRESVDSVDDRVTANRAVLDTPQMKAIEDSTITQSTTTTSDPTTLNNTLGINGNPFAMLYDNADAASVTRLVTRFSGTYLGYGAGRLAQVRGGVLYGYELIPFQAETREDETRYITDSNGHGTPAEPLVIPFGAGGQARDFTESVSVGYPAVGAIVNNISLSFFTLSNGNRTNIGNTIQLNVRSGETREFSVPNYAGVTFRAIDRQTSVELQTINRAGADQIVTHNASIGVIVGYVETVVTDEIPRGQREINLGAWTHENLFAIDFVATGDSDTGTIFVVTPTRRYNVGYFRSDAHRQSFVTDNPGFTFYNIDANAPFTPEVIAQLDATSDSLGLYQRTNHSADVLDLITGLRVRTADGVNAYNVPETLKTLSEIPRGTGLTTQQARDITQEEINSSQVIQANTAKPTSEDVNTIADDRIKLSIEPGNVIAEYVEANSGDDITPEALNEALAKFDEANPFSLFNKFSTDGDFQISNPFNAEVAMAHNFSSDVTDTDDRRLVVNILPDPTKLTAKVQANIPFVLSHEGKIRIVNDNNGAKFIRVTREVTYFPGETFAFVLSNSEIVRTTGTWSGDIDLNVFDRTVLLKQTTVDRFPIAETTPVAMKIYFEISNTRDLANLEWSEDISNDLTFEFVDFGVIFAQQARIVGPKGDMGNDATGGTTQAEKDAIQANTAKVGVSDELLEIIQLNTNKISYTPELQAVTDANTFAIDSHTTQFGASIRGDWPRGNDLVSPGNLTELKMGDLVTQGDTIYEALQDITSIGSSFAPDANGSAWRRWELQTQPYDDSGLVEMVNGKTTPEEAKDQAVEAINDSLGADQPIANYVRDNSNGVTGNELDSGSRQLRIENIGFGNFSIPVPANQVPGATTFGGLLTLVSRLGTNPSGYNYVIRYADGDMAVLLGTTTATFTEGGTKIAIAPINIQSGRPLEIEIGTNGGSGSQQMYTLDAVLGVGEQGILYTPALNLIDQQIALIPPPEAGVSLDAINEALSLPIKGEPAVLGTLVTNTLSPNIPLTGGVNSGSGRLTLPIPRDIPEGNTTYTITMNTNVRGVGSASPTVNWTFRYTSNGKSVVTPVSQTDNVNGGADIQARTFIVDVGTALIIDYNYGRNLSLDAFGTNPTGLNTIRYQYRQVLTPATDDIPGGALYEAIVAIHNSLTDK